MPQQHFMIIGTGISCGSFAGREDMTPLCRILLPVFLPFCVPILEKSGQEGLPA